MRPLPNVHIAAARCAGNKFVLPFMSEITQDYIAQKLIAAGKNADAENIYAEMALDPTIRLKGAAVLVPLVHFEDEWHLLFTRRTDRVESHKGQVSFPGGASDEGETTPEQTALREAQEEIGLDPAHVTVLGRLSRMVTVSSFQVSGSALCAWRSDCCPSSIASRSITLPIITASRTTLGTGRAGTHLQLRNV